MNMIKTVSVIVDLILIAGYVYSCSKDKHKLSVILLVSSLLCAVILCVV